MSKLNSTFLFLFTLFATAAQGNVTPKAIHTLHHWPAISNVIEYQERIWFVNSSPYKDTNVADIYSYHPASGVTQFERSLFSQDAGTPVVHNGLLYWPLEDPRRSAGVGEYVVTDGRTWSWRVMESGKAMHVHALESCGDRLIAVTGSWTGQFLSRDNATDKWQLEYDYPAGSAAFSRLVDAEYFNSTCYLAGSANNDPSARLLQIVDGKAEAIAGWPKSDRVDGLTAHGAKLYAWVDTGSTRTLQAFNGTAVETVQVKENHRIRDLHSTGPVLFMITSSGKSGALWSLNQSNSFELVSELPFIPLSITSTEKHGVFIGSYHRKGPTLWQIDLPDTGTSTHSTATIDPLDRALPAMTESQIEAIYSKLKNIITDPSNGENKANKLRAELARPEELAHPAFAAILTRLLEVPLPDATVTLFTNHQAPWKQLVHWYLLGNMAINGQGSIDPAMLTTPWTGQATQSNKYFDPTVMAIVATGWLKQNNQSTVTALITRLTTGDDPLWLQSDITGALTAITDQRFGLDIPAWQRWFQNNYP